MNSIINNEFIPLSFPTIEDEEICEVIDSLKSGWITTGPKVIKFEKMFCKRLNVPHAIAVCSCTAAWHILAYALEIKKGDEVIIPSITWPSMANIVELLGAKPVFADVDIDTLQISINHVKQLINPNTKIILPVHFAGAPADLDSLKSTVKDTGIKIIEDAAHALGTQYKKIEIGSNSFAALFSFHAIKNITTGEGGMIVCRDSKLADKLRLLLSNGMNKNAWTRYSVKSSPQYDVIMPGFKYNMMDIQASLGICQLPKLDNFIEKRNQLAINYNRLLEKITELEPIKLCNYEHKHSWHLYIIKINLDKLTITRNEFINELKKNNIGAGVHFEAVHSQSYYKNKYSYNNKDLPNADILGKSILSLPLYPTLNYEKQTYIINTIKNIILNYKKIYQR